MRCPWSWARVLKASTAVTDLEKLTWLEDHGFDLGPEGSYADHAVIAARLGKSAAVIKQVRYRLRQLGLYRVVPRPGAKQAFGWIPTLPAQCQPGPRPSVNEVALLAVELNAHVNINRGAGGAEPSTGVHATVNGDSRHRQPALTVRAGGVPVEGGRGEAPFSASTVTEGQLPSQLNSPEEGVSGIEQMREVIRRSLAESGEGGSGRSRDGNEEGV